ncbi:hypothetical protein CXB51_031460 [Gossypium anomalum]|uniref:OTU domain-containing protein n=1 Tax=Gossypium anomalum TaxID=47600 RepID=A0A8J6CLL6_9ROSI|nr:hypothetical protein CXB51_031460 [Gossypium anomalum]
MVKTRQQKSKPKPKKQQQHPQVKKQGKQADISLDALGLKIIKVTADGNCFFQHFIVILEVLIIFDFGEVAHSFQLAGLLLISWKFCKNLRIGFQMFTLDDRNNIMNREMFEPFIEDDVPFDEYCQSMEKDGTWAGHMELQAASLVTRRNICIHRNMSPRWYIKNFQDRAARMVHLSYHDEEHYNSVRLKEDPCNGPAMPIIIKADADISVSSNQAKAAVSKTKGAAGKDCINTGSIKLVMAGSGCESEEKVEQVLLQVDGDVDAAIEFLIAEQGAEECTAANDSLTCHANGSYGNGRAAILSVLSIQVHPSISGFMNPSCADFQRRRNDENGNSEQHKEENVGKTCEQDPSSDGTKTLGGNTPWLDEKKIPRNKLCPCGSKKKYKACCGSVSGRSSTKIMVNQPMEARKGRKERKQSNKGVSAKSAVLSGSDGGPPDMGALCI